MNITPENKKGLCRGSLVVIACVASVAAFATPVNLNINYSDHIEGFGDALKTAISNNIGMLLVVLAMVITFGWVWNHLRRMGRSL
jgi:hypothetical protein